MAGEEQYYNPIVQAMIASAQNRRAIAQQEIEKQRAFDEKQAREQAAKIADQHFQAEHELQLKAHDLAEKQLGLHRQMADFQAAQSRTQIMQGLQKWVQEGGNPDVFLKHVGIPNVMPSQSPLNPNVDQSQLGPGHPDFQGPPTATQGLQPNFESALTANMISDPTAEANRVKTLASAQSSGAAEGKLPAEKELLSMKNAFESRENDKKFTESWKEHKLSSDTQLSVARINADAHLRAAAIGKEVPQITGNTVVAALTGQGGKLDISNKYDRAVLDSITGMGARSVDPKEIQALKESQKLIPIFKRLEDFVRNNLSDNRLGAAVMGHIQSGVKNLGYTSATQNDLANIRSQALNIGRSLEGMTGRPLAKQMEIDLDSLVNAGLSKEDAIARVNNLKELYINNQENSVMGGMPAFQKELIFKTQGIKPAWLVTAPKQNSAGHKLDEEESLKYGRPVYSN